MDFEYVDAELRHIDAGGELSFWRHFHWGLFSSPDLGEEPAQRYVPAAEAMTERVVAAAGVVDGGRVLDVGCGFGGTLDYVRSRNRGCRLVGVNIDDRQLQLGRSLLPAPDETGGVPLAFVVSDGCRLPFVDGAFDHVLAIECLFHFSSRREFFEEAARVLEPGGTVALSDFLFARGRLAEVAGALVSETLDEGGWYGRVSRPLSAAGYERLGRRAGLELVLDDDVTALTLPTYAVLRFLSDVSETPGGGITMVDRFEQLSVAGALEYHVLAFRRL